VSCSFDRTFEITYSYGGHKPFLSDHEYYEDTIQISRCCILPAQWYIKSEEFLKIEDIIGYLYGIPDKKTKPLYVNHPMCDGNNCVILHNIEVKDIIVGLSYACNLNCYHCWFEGLHRATTLKKTLYFHTLNNIKKHNLNSITLTNKGEPFFYLRETMDYLRKLSIRDTKCVSSVTNGNCLSKDSLEEIKSLREYSGINYKFLFSIDAISEETYNLSRHGGNFHKVLENMGLAVKFFGKENVSASFTCKKTNVKEVNNAGKFFMNNFGISTSITFDYYDQDISKYYIDS